MATRTATKGKSSPDESGSAETTLQATRARIKIFHGKKQLDALRDEAITLISKLEVTSHYVEKLDAYQRELKSKLDALTAHEHYSVVITNVSRNGNAVVEVAGLSGNRVEVAVHPDIDCEDLVVGATGLVTRERNCLLKVTGRSGRWSDVGTFESHAGSDERILVRDRESLVAIDLSHALRNTKFSEGDLIGFDRNVAGMAYERLAPPKGEHLFDDNVTDDFSQLGGLDNEIARIKRHIDFRILHSAVAEKYRLKSKCGILLNGVPGNGKTRIARCCAGYLKSLYPNRACRFMHVEGSSDYDMWFGESERKIVERFRAAREAAVEGLVIMFWDEVDAIARRRGTDHGSGAPDRILNTFLSQLDGIVPLLNVIIIFATNRADTLDPGLLRPGRTDVTIEIPPPKRRAAQAILRRYLGRGLPLDAGHRDVDDLILPLLTHLFAPNGRYAEVAQVRLSDGRRLPVAGRQLLSGATLENVVEHASQEAAAREVDSGQEGVTEEDLALALDLELVTAVARLAPGNAKNYVPSIPQEAQPIAVDALLTSTSSSFVRAGVPATGDPSPATP